MNRTPNSVVIIIIQDTKLRNVANSGSSRNSTRPEDELRAGTNRMHSVNVIETQKMEPEEENAESQ